MKVRRAKPRPPPSRAQVALKRAKEKFGPRSRDRLTTYQDAERVQVAMRMLEQGQTTYTIARELGIDYQLAAKLVDRGLAEVQADIGQLANELVARERAIIRANWAAAIGGVIVDPKTGKQTRVPKDWKAVEAIQRANRNIGIVIRAKISQEHSTTIMTTGPVVTTGPTVLSDPQEMARLIAEEFKDQVAETPLVIDVTAEPGELAPEEAASSRDTA